MIEKLQETFHNRCPFDFTRILVVGVSGGPDSLCLLDLLSKSGLKLVLAHMNHQLRTEADQEAIYIRKIADRYDIPCVVKVKNVGAYAEAHGLSVEEAARILRYRFLFSEAETRNAQAVVVGHTADDQVETVLMHLLRGAGLEGLRGMETWQVPNAWSQEITLARPLLGIWREEIEAYCRENDLTPLIDLSNFEKTYFRNRLRHEAIPLLETYSPHLKEKLLRMAEVLRGDLQILEPVVESAWRDCLKQDGDGYVAFNRGILNEKLEGMQRRLIRKAMDHLRPGLRDIGFAVIERALSFLKRAESGGQVDLANGLRLVVEGESVWVAAWEADLPEAGWPSVKGNPVPLSIPGSISLGDGWHIDLHAVLDVEEVKKLAFHNNNPYQTWLDEDKISGVLELRSRREGDRIKPLGMEGHRVKLSDLMVNLKIPRRARMGWPLICIPEEVLWIPGYATSHTSRIQPESKRIIHIRLIHQG